MPASGEHLAESRPQTVAPLVEATAQSGQGTPFLEGSLIGYYDLPVFLLKGAERRTISKTAD